MQDSQKITLEEFLSDAHIVQDEESDGYQSHYRDTYESKFEFISKVAKPQDRYLEAFKESHSLFSSSRTSIRSSRAITGRYDINWLSPDDYLLNWEKLSKYEQVTFRMLVMSDFKSNSNRYGLKTKNLEAHLLLNLGCDMNNILNSPNCAVRSNLRSPGIWTKDGEFVKGDFSTLCSDNRTIDAKTCMRSFYKFNRNHDVEKLFKCGLVCYQLVIRSDSSYRKILKDDPIESKRRIHSFFRENASYLSKLVNKKKKILSYLYSHEISVDSIVKEEYRPHTHSIVFIKRSNPLQEQEEIELIEKEFNSVYSDREMSLERIVKDDSLVPRRGSKFKDIEYSIGYLFRAYSLAEGYLREIRSDNIRELNQKTVECYRNLIWLFKAEEANGLKGVRRFNSSYIPEKNDSTLYKHPLLQKRKKSNTIKKENSKIYVSTRKPSQNKPSDAQRAGSAKSCESSRVQEDSTRARAQRRVLSRSNQRTGKALGSSISSRAGDDAAQKSILSADLKHTAKCSRRNSSAADASPVCSSRPARFISKQDGRQPCLSASTDAIPERADSKGKPKHASACATTKASAASSTTAAAKASTTAATDQICGSSSIRSPAPQPKGSGRARLWRTEKPKLCTSLSTQQKQRRELSSIPEPRA
jgi:hypothetical protein